MACMNGNFTINSISHIIFERTKPIIKVVILLKMI